MAEVQVQDKGEKGGKVRSKKQSTRVDMTPMVDLGFLLITFFMFTTTFSNPNVMDLALPAKPKNENQNTEKPEIDLSNSITVILGKNNRIFYHQQDQIGLNAENLKETNFDRQGISHVIQEAKSKAKKPEIFTVIVKPTEDALYKNFVDILDELAVANKMRYGLTDIKSWEKAIYDQKIKQP